MGSLNKFLCIGIGLVWLGNMMHMSGIATPRWVKTSIAKTDYQGLAIEVSKFTGLFESCQQVAIPEIRLECRDLMFRDVNMKRQVAQVLAYLAMCLGLVGLGSAIVYQLFVLLTPRQVCTAAIITFTSIATTSCVAAFGLILSLISLVADRLVEDGKTDYSFFLCMLGGCLFLAGAILITLSSKFLSQGNDPAVNDGENAPRNNSSTHPTVGMAGDTVEIRLGNDTGAKED